jgi:hypothetical protein
MLCILEAAEAFVSKPPSKCIDTIVTGRVGRRMEDALGVLAQEALEELGF